MVWLRLFFLCWMVQAHWCLNFPQTLVIFGPIVLAWKSENLNAVFSSQFERRGWTFDIFLIKLKLWWTGKVRGTQKRKNLVNILQKLNILKGCVSDTHLWNYSLFDNLRMPDLLFKFDFSYFCLIAAELLSFIKQRKADFHLLCDGWRVFVTRNGALLLFS